MTDTLITQCPHCQTRFRLTHQQLEAARGAVRCGTCLQVFNAASQLSSSTSTDSAASVRSTSDVTSNTSATSDASFAHDDLYDLDIDQELARLEHEEQQRSQNKSAQAAAPQAPRTTATTPAVENTENISLNTQDTWNDSEEPITTFGSALSAETVTIIPEASASTPLDTAQNSDTLADNPFELSAEPLSHYIDEPLRLDWRPKKGPWKRWLAWGLLNILALLLLAGQYTYNNFTQLARQDTTRPWLAAACPLFDCQLPSKVDVQQIKSSNLLVRSHPEFSGALLVDAIIYNRAAFSQPFPLLELTFSDQYGQLLARRLFKPQEYLDGELAGQKQMPPQTPIHIALEILEPSGGADNYSLNFISPE